MLNRKIIILVTAILLMSQSGSIYAESLNLDLETAKIIALENNPTIKIAREGVKKSRAMVTEARANLMPVIRGFSSFQHAWELPTMVFNIGGVQQKFKMGTENNIVYGINVSQPLFTGGAIWNGFQMSRIGRNIAEAQLKSIEQKLLSDVTRAYYGVLFANSALDVALEALESSKKNLEQVNKFFNAGKSSRFDVLRAEVQVANFKPMVVSSKNGLRLAESNLSLVLGISDSVNYVFKEKLKFTESDLSHKRLDELLGIALQNRPELLMMQEQKSIARKQLTIARAASMPSVIFGTSYQYQGMRDNLDFTHDDFYKSFNSTLTLSIPLFSGLKNSSKLQQAKIAIKETGHQEESLINVIKLEVKSAYFIMKEAEEKVETQKKTIELATEALRLANLMYTEGASTQLDVLNSNLALNQAKMNYQQSLFEYNVALANLKKAINQL